MLPVFLAAAAAAIGLGLYAVSRQSAPAGNRYRVAPGGVGRIYGTPSVTFQPAFWVDARVKIGCGPDGSPWVAEGARFLPADTTVKQLRPTLIEALAVEQSAWPYVEFLYRKSREDLTKGMSGVSDSTHLEIVTALVIGSVGGSGAMVDGGNGCDPDKFGREGLAANNWALDVQQRINNFALARGYEAN